MRGRTYTLTGPELPSTPDQVGILRKVLGYAIALVDVPLDVAREQMIAPGGDPDLAEGAVCGRRFIGPRGNARLTAGVATVLGRTARA